jgi:hypothetical protein
MSDRLVSGLLGVFMATLAYPILMRVLSRKTHPGLDKRAQIISCLGAGFFAAITQWLVFKFQH